MEWALLIPRGQALPWVEEPWGNKENSWMAEVKEVCEEQFGTLKFTRMYFGQEFCEKALPSLKELEQALSESARLGMKFTLVTSYVTEPGLNIVKGLLERLSEVQPRAEVVVNDWGVLETITKNYPTLTPVLGRLLNKVLRDPRLLTHLKKPKDQALERFRTSNLAGEPMQELLDQYKVRRIELDLPPQGLDDHLADWGYRSSIYLPFGVITTGRICLLHSWGLEEREKFKPFSGGCDRKCRYYWLEMSDPTQQVKKSKHWLILQKGNSVFYRQQKDFLKEGLDKARSLGVTRLVVQREPI